MTGRTFIFICLLNSVGGPIHAVNDPELPRLFMRTAYDPPRGGAVIPVRTSGEFQAALQLARPGDIIEMQAGNTFTGPFTLPNKTSGNGWIYIRSSAWAELPSPCSRVSPSDSLHMPKIVVKAGSPGAIVTASNAHHFRFVGIEFTPVANNFVYNIVWIGNGETESSRLPNNIVFDRCYIHGDPAAGSRRGILMNGNAIAVIDSYLSDCKEQGADSQALGCYSGDGPYKIVNNYLEGAGENVMFGGADPTIPNAVPADIEIRCNSFYKPLDWMHQSWSVKNLLEFKNARRVLVEGNRFENCWVNAQTGFALVLTPRNQNNTAPWSCVQDIVVRYNTILNVAGGVNLLGHDSPNVSDRTARILIRDNLFQLAQVGTGTNGRLFQILSGPAEVVIDHNTGFSSYTYLMADGSPKIDSFVFTNNIVTQGQYGFVGTGTANGNTTLDTYFNPGWRLDHNLVIGGSAKNYPPGNQFPADTGAVGFRDYAGGNFRLAPGSPHRGGGADGKDPGADFDSIAIASLYRCDSLSTGVSWREAATPGKLSVYPNPADRFLRIVSTPLLDPSVGLAVFDILGNKVLAGNAISGRGELDLRNIPAGVYLLIVEQGKTISGRIFLVRR